MRTYGPQSNQRQFSRGEFNQVDSWCPATSQHFWKCGLWTTEFNSNFQTARSRHETTWMWNNMTLDVIYSAKGSKWQLPVFTQKIKTEEETAWNIADLIQVFLQSILYECIHDQFKPHTVPQVNTQQKTSKKTPSAINVCHSDSSRFLLPKFWNWLLKPWLHKVFCMRWASMVAFDLLYLVSV